MKPIRVGIVGCRRGTNFAQQAQPAGLTLAALCDRDERALNALRAQYPGASVYTDYDAFLAHDLDAVVLANFFHQHAPFAVKALRAGKHVLSETAACFTLAEGVELIRTVEKTGRIYMLAENYAYMRHAQEMRRVFRRGTLGEFLYGEGCYTHPASAAESARLAPDPTHWRRWLPATYYCTHSLAPIMYITDTRPVQVHGFLIPRAGGPPAGGRRRALGSVIMLRMDNGALVRLLQGGLRGGITIYTRLFGSKGAMHGSDFARDRVVTVIRDALEARTPRAPTFVNYIPSFPRLHAEALRAGHGGGDLFVNYYFARAIRRREPPFLDVTRGVAMSIVGPLAYRSALAGSAPVEVPDLRLESVRRRYAHDDWSPAPQARGPAGKPAPAR